MPSKEAMGAAEAVQRLADEHRAVHEFAVNLIDLVLVRLEELSARESVDTVELQSVVDELRVGRRELTTKISRI